MEAVWLEIVYKNHIIKINFNKKLDVIENKW